ncbi:hypothetical protein GCM10010277_22730 [Streptomyces longisporoflavus]|uniref:hypothetical protein n=1 Tax=Streptomyces longisporoflavus TaxID=28044 RepID=UPI0019B118E2|nr:hypothetical protein [Streptomyces longisporoflavus]GGV36303.1 hypothetical protein GCM10010277_22730 [Streptomyces longisporoflavus]
MSDVPPHIDAGTMARLVPMSAAIEAVEAVLKGGLAPGRNPRGESWTCRAASSC